MLWWPRAPTSFLPPPLQPKKIALDGSAQGFREIDCQAVPGGPARVVEAMKCPLSKQQRRRFSGIYTAVAIPALFLTYLCLHLSPMLFGDKQMSGKAVLQLCIWLPLTVMFFLCLFTTMYTHPGKMPESLKCDDQKDNYRLNCTETKNGETRVCKFCEMPKPERCHHCQFCKLCILKKDHHCFYLRSCIGFYNYKSFVLCIIYGGMLCQFMLWTMAWSVVSYVNGTGPLTVKIWMCAGEALLLILSLLLTVFSIFHVCLIRRGLTTIEYHEEKKGRAGGIYDQGSWRNFTSIFGQVPVLWFFPWGMPHGDGMSFERKSCEEVQSKPGLLNPARRQPPMPKPVKAVQWGNEVAGGEPARRFALNLAQGPVTGVWAKEPNMGGFNFADRSISFDFIPTTTYSIIYNYISVITPNSSGHCPTWNAVKTPNRWSLFTLPLQFTKPWISRLNGFFWITVQFNITVPVSCNFANNLSMMSPWNMTDHLQWNDSHLETTWFLEQKVNLNFKELP